MLRRPKPTDSEEDLLKEQEHFLTSGAPSAASVVRRPDKRRGEAGGQNGENEGNQKDVVTIEGYKWVVLLRQMFKDVCVLPAMICFALVFDADLPDELPSLTPAPAKKSRFKASRVTFEDEDAEDRLDKHDSHISAVLSRIVVSVLSQITSLNGVEKDRKDV